MGKQSKLQQETIARVMEEYKEGDLKSGSGDKVEDRKQAIAIALSEAGASDRQSPKENRRRLRKAARDRPQNAQTKAQLYAEARRKNVRGRSRMSREQLERAVKG